MTLTLTLTPEKESRLAQRASAAGLSLDNYVQRVVELAASETEEEEQARLNDAMAHLIQKAHELQPIARMEAAEQGHSESGRPDQGYEDAIVEKYRRQGFNL